MKNREVELVIVITICFLIVASWLFATNGVLPIIERVVFSIIFFVFLCFGIVWNLFFSDTLRNLSPDQQERVFNSMCKKMQNRVDLSEIAKVNPVLAQVLQEFETVTREQE